MKIGILTFHCAYNYGAVLQCYALQEAVKKLGHEVQIIDYRPEYIVKPYKVFRWGRLLYKDLRKTLRSCLKEPFLIGQRVKRRNVFNYFISNRLNLSTRIVKECIAPYDVYIMGSDQIWNPKITKGLDPIYFGVFPFPKGNERIISYAASVGSESVVLELQEQLRKLLINFDAISVRENQLAITLKHITGRDIDTVLDPTMLLDSSHWIALARTPSIKQKYILTYQDGAGCTLRIGKLIAKEINAVVIQIPLSPFVSFRRNIKHGASPEDFLGWIKNAACVVTPSFHGTVFSIIFGRPFFCVEFSDGSNIRVRSLLSSLGLDDRIVGKSDNPKFTPINYETVASCWAIQKEKSIAFLRDSIL